LKTNQPKYDYILLLIVSVLILLGSVMVYSSSSAIAQGAMTEAGRKYSSHAFFLKRQLIYFLVAYLAMYVAARFDVERLRRLLWPLLLSSSALLLVVFFAPVTRGTHRWLPLGIVSIQPSELFKYILVLYLAHSLSQKGRSLDTVKNYLWPYGPIILGGALLILLEPDLGVVLVMGATVIVLFYLAGARLMHIGAAIGGSAAAVYTVVFVFGYRKTRVLDFFNWVADPMQAPYQIKQSILSMANGGIFGVGLGDGIFKQFFLPEPHTDFIFASIGEELGLWGLLLTLGLFFGLLWRGLRIATRQPSRYRFLLASGLVLCLGVNICVNIAVALGLIPTTGLTLPFLSYGGSSLVVSSAAVGLLLNLSRQRVGAEG